PVSAAGLPHRRRIFIEDRGNFPEGRPAMIRRLALAAALFAAACTGEAPSPAVGDWSGNIQAPPISPRLGVHIESEGGELTGSIDLPDRGVWDKPVEDVSYEDGVLAFSSP